MTIPHVHSQASAAQRPHGYGLGNLEARLARVDTREPGKTRLIGDNWSRMPHSWSYPPLGSLEHPEFLSSWVLSFFFLASRFTQPVQWTVWGIAMTTSTLGGTTMQPLRAQSPNTKQPVRILLPSHRPVWAATGLLRPLPLVQNHARRLAEGSKASILFLALTLAYTKTLAGIPRLPCANRTARLGWLCGLFCPVSARSRHAWPSFA